jgi:hypothetical protein
MGIWLVLTRYIRHNPPVLSRFHGLKGHSPQGLDAMRIFHRSTLHIHQGGVSVKRVVSNQCWVSLFVASLLVVRLSTSAFGQTLPRPGAKRAMGTSPVRAFTETDAVAIGTDAEI